MAWRIGARHITRELELWLATWVDFRCVGGLPKGSVQSAHARLVQAMRDPSFLFIGQDLSKFFDHIAHTHLQFVLGHLGAPPAFANLVKHFYEGNQRIFTSRGSFGGSWHKVDRGILQGCPFSPMLAAAVMTFWTSHVAQADVDCVAYIDDRCFWSRCPNAAILAKNRSDEFDGIFGFSCSAAKCQLAYPPGLAAGLQVAPLLGYKHGQRLDILGLRYELASLTTSLLKFDLAKAQARLRYVKAAAGSFNQKIHHIRRLVLPSFCWAAGFALLPDHDLSSLQKNFKQVFDRRLLKDTPFCILKEILGWNTWPDFASQWATLLVGCRFHCRPIDTRMTDPALQEMLWPQMFPTIQPVLDALQWWADASGRYIHRTDSYGSVRRFKVGHDSLSILHEWLCDFHRERELRLHRDDPQCATGLDLPGPPERGFCLFAGHRVAWASDGTKYLKHAAMASGRGAVFGTSFLVAAPLIRGICDGIVAVASTSLAGCILCGRALRQRICALLTYPSIELKNVFSPKLFKSVLALVLCRILIPFMMTSLLRFLGAWKPPLK